MSVCTFPDCKRFCILLLQVKIFVKMTDMKLKGNLWNHLDNMSAYSLKLKKDVDLFI